MLKTTGIVVLVLFAIAAAVLIFAATRPDTFRVERTTMIKAPAAKIFPLINDLHRHVDWSPWEKGDPVLQRTYGGAPSGKGAVYEWRGNKEVGQGRMEITESSPSSKIALKLDFLKPFEAHNIVEYTLQPDGDATKVTQAMFGPSPYIAKVMGLIFSMDSMVGTKFEEGLANLKGITEK